MQKVGLIGWRGMVGSVLMERMQQENDFDLIDAVFFSTSQAGQKAPSFNGKDYGVLQDAYDLDALKAINVPVLEKVNLPSIYTNADGVPVTSNNEAMVGYLNLKKLKQIVTKKSGYNTNIDVRNPKTGQIVGNAKGVESDRELESLILQNMETYGGLCQKTKHIRQAVMTDISFTEKPTRPIF